MMAAVGIWRESWACLPPTTNSRAVPRLGSGMPREAKTDLFPSGSREALKESTLFIIIPRQRGVLSERRDFLNVWPMSPHRPVSCKDLAAVSTEMCVYQA